MPTDKPYNGQTPWQPGARNTPTAFVTYDKGYDIESIKRDDDETHDRSDYQNCAISNGTDYMGLWIYDVQVDIGLAGSTAQSQRTRTFYPRNFVQPSFVLLGQAPTQLEYGRMVEFIHFMQQQALSGVLSTLTLPSTDNRGGYDNPTVPSDFEARDTFTPSGRIKTPAAGARMKGHHQGISAQGYIKLIDRHHEAFKQAPDYTLSFVVSHMHDGPFQDTASHGSQTDSAWASIIENSLSATIAKQKSAADLKAAEKVTQAKIKASGHTFTTLNTVFGS